jgi:hypothetical protein
MVEINENVNRAINGYIVEIVGITMPCQGRSCEDHPFGCGLEVLRRGVVVRFRHE